MTKQHQQEIEKTRKTIAITIDTIEEKIAKELAEKRANLINEATQIAKEIIERELNKETTTNDKNNLIPEKTTEQKNQTKKQKIELNEENIKILRQLQEIQKTKNQERKERKEQEQTQKNKEKENLEKGKKIVEEKLKQMEMKKEWTG